ncbi:MAG: hypothetical protein FWH22_03820, partial [Fibromonadales bacterium]|nr:hypothetical protein [Fibromonadales bacterium]
MKKAIVFLAILLSVNNAAARAMPQFKAEKLDRGLVAVRNGSNTFLSWRLFGADPVDIQFNVYQGNSATPLNSTPLSAAQTNYTVTGGTNATYQVAVLINNEEAERTPAVSVWQNQYLEIPVEKPTGRLYNFSSKNFSQYTDYSIYDGTVADLDGDGQYEIIFFWAPDNLQDNSIDGMTANVFIDAYKLDGTKLWGSGKYIDLGPNIRAGAHYTTFLVYDFDGCGKAEIIVKTADGT